jgi:hypothetical protein
MKPTDVLLVLLRRHVLPGEQHNRLIREDAPRAQHGTQLRGGPCCLWKRQGNSNVNNAETHVAVWCLGVPGICAATWRRMCDNAQQ